MCPRRGVILPWNFYTHFDKQQIIYDACRSKLFTKVGRLPGLTIPRKRGEQMYVT